jgi:hypothetical protein
MSKTLAEAILEFALALLIVVTLFTVEGLEEVVHFLALFLLAYFAGQYVRRGHL